MRDARDEARVADVETPPLSKRAAHGAAALSGLMLVAAFPHLDWGWIAWVALVPLLLTLSRVPLTTAIGQGFTFGFFYFGGLLYWLIVVGYHSLGLTLGIVAWLVAVFAQISVMLLFTAGAWLLARKGDGPAWFWGVPAWWAILEWVRQLGPLGTTWGDLSVAQHAFLPVLQVSKLTGVWGVSFMVALANVAVAAVIADWRTPKPPSRDVIAATLVLAAALVYGLVTMYDDHLRPTYTIAALQPDIDPNVDWTKDRPYVGSTISSYVAAGTRAAQKGAVIAVWPEASFPGLLRFDYLGDGLPILEEATRYHQTLFIGSSELALGETHEANSLIEVMPTGWLGGSYQKRHLVPWGEYVPGRRWFPFLAALHLTLYDRKAGADVQPLFNTPQGKMGAVICYESSYPELSREQVARGAGLMMIVSDDTWYGQTAAPQQHANFAVLRAVESDRYLVRAGATGVSMIVDPVGRIITRAPLYTSDVLTARVQTRHNLTPYARFGDWFVGLCCLILAAGLAILRGNVRSSDR